MHNPIKNRCAVRKTAESWPCHSFPDFENSDRQHQRPPDRSEDHFRRADFVKGQFVAADGKNGVHSPADDHSAVDVQQQAFDAGYQEGLLVGRQTAEARLQPLVENIQKAVHDVNRHGEKLYAAAQTQAVELALAVARKIIAQEVAVNPSVVVASLQRALEGLAREAIVTVVMHPDDLKFIKTLPSGELPDMGEETGKIVFESDPAIEPGGCMVKTADGDRDASIDGQLDAVATAFDEVLGQGAHSVLTPGRSDDS